MQFEMLFFEVKKKKCEEEANLIFSFFKISHCNFIYMYIKIKKIYTGANCVSYNNTKKKRFVKQKVVNT